MRYNPRFMLSRNGGEQGTAPQSAVDENLSPVSELREAALRSLGLSARLCTIWEKEPGMTPLLR